jgi:hypothetical protein
MKIIEQVFDLFALERLKVKLSEKIGWLISNKSDCLKLSQIILENNSGKISDSTIYRIFFQSEKHKPYKYSLDILCKFIGFRDSRDFLYKIQDTREALHFNGISTEHQYKKSLLFYSLEHQAKYPLMDFFEETSESSHEFKRDISITIFDSLQMSSKQQWFFKNFAQQNYIRKYFFERGHDPKFRIKEYEYGYIEYLKNIDKEKDVHQLQDFLFGHCVLFRYYFLCNQTEQALSIGKILFEAEDLADIPFQGLYIFPFIRFKAYLLWYYEITFESRKIKDDYAHYLLNLVKRLKANFELPERKILFHTVAETFLYSSLSLSFHQRLKELFAEEFKRIPEAVYNKHLKYSLSYFEQNGLLHFRP